MDATIQTIPVINLLIAFVPVAILLVIMLTWAQKTGQALYAIARDGAAIGCYWVFAGVHL